MRTWPRCDMGLTIQFFFYSLGDFSVLWRVFLQSENHLLSYSITLHAMLTE